jgi:hypothetical protein
MIAHLACRTEAGLRYVDVWQTKNDFDAFEHGRLHPVVHPLLQDMLGFVPPEPPKTALDIVNAWTAEHAQIARHPVTHAIGKLPNGSSSPHSVTNSPPPNDGARAALPIRSER